MIKHCIIFFFAINSQTTRSKEKDITFANVTQLKKERKKISIKKGVTDVRLTRGSMYTVVFFLYQKIVVMCFLSLTKEKSRWILFEVSTRSFLSVNTHQSTLAYLMSNRNKFYTIEGEMGPK